MELDSRFLTELTHTAALYAELFEPGGRKRLVKVGRGKLLGLAGIWARSLQLAALWQCVAVAPACRLRRARGALLYMGLERCLAPR